ncbi:MAG: hypothetical protein CVU43_07140 [Chloroflexi bacterium HGW-Chloroflexi-5]|jgi:glycosyltransferase involved in cell wall biosynthesis|nr:MAG: hypothetical protein CVU43_07140 [Chloroflexi bacterium HGW-Chloroflexi-5]
MKIFIVPTWHPTEQNPHFANWILPHISASAQNGNEVIVLYVDTEAKLPNAPVDDSFLRPKYITDHHLYIPMPKKNNRFLRTRFFYGKILNEYTSKLRELYKIAEAKWGKPDLIHAHVSLPAGYGSAIIGRENDVPVVVTEHYTGFEYDAKYFWRVGYFVKEMGKIVSGFYAVSPGFAERINQTGLLKVDGSLPNPININYFKCEHKLIKSDTFNIVTTGSLGWRKGTDILLEALSLINNQINWKLTLFGNLPDEHKFKKWLNNPNFNNRILLNGCVSQSELVNTYANSDLFVVSSRVETANVSMLEALSCGIPVITTRCGAPETLINNKVGISVPSENAHALAQGVLRMANNIGNYPPEKMREFVVNNYSMEKISSLLALVYDTAIQKKKTL